MSSDMASWRSANGRRSGSTRPTWRWRGATASPASAPSCVKRDLAGIVVYDPLNVRYATDSTDMQLWCTHNAVRYAFVATEGPVILWDFHNCEHLSWHLDAVDEIRHGKAWFYYEAGEHAAARARLWAAEIADLVRAAAAATGGSPSTRSIRTASSPWPSSASVTERRGGDGARPHRQMRRRAEGDAPRRRRLRGGDGGHGGGAQARHDRERALGDPARGKHPPRRRVDRDAPALLRPAHQSLVPGMLRAGHRGRRHRRLRHRPDRPLRLLLRHLSHLARRRRAAHQRAARALCHGGGADRLQHGDAAAGPHISASFRIAAASLPAEYLPNRYSVLFHGVGLCDEYPAVPYSGDWERSGYDGVLEPTWPSAWKAMSAAMAATRA